MNKICTSLEQSKKLKELGINIDTADMWYLPIQRNEKIYYDLTVHCSPTRGIIPAWSLTALLGVLPDYSLQTNTDGTVFVVCESKKPTISDAYDNPIDAVFEMVVVWLNENNKI